MIHASLFSGIGGAELAASWMGWDNAFHCEINEFPRKVLEYWFPNSISYEDITKTDFSKWRERIDVLTGGFPCQPFSVSGRRRGAEDDRYLWTEMLRAIREIQPTWVVGENVAGIVSMVQPSQNVEMGRADYLFEENKIYRAEHQFTIDVICKDLECAGYSVQPIVIPACAVGAPHRRDRVWIIAHRTDTGIESVQQEGQNRVREIILASDTKRNGRFCTKNHIQLKIATKKRSCGSSMFEDASYSQDKEKATNIPDFRDFPTQSPVCNGNDGLPFRVADLSISFSKWRDKSIAALGNSWVPQVAYEIFKTIELFNLQALERDSENKEK